MVRPGKLMQRRGVAAVHDRPRWHDSVQEVLARVPGVALALDDGLRILAASPGAVEALARPRADIVGRRCHEVVAAVDPRTGRPCHEACALAQRAGQSGWALTRRVQGRWQGEGSAGLDCLLLRCLLPSSGRYHLWFVGPPPIAGANAHSRVMEAFQALYPVLSRSADLDEALAAALAAVVEATSAEGGEVALLDSATGGTRVVRAHGLPGEDMRELYRSAVGDRFLDASEGGETLLVAAGEWPGGPHKGDRGWYMCVPLVAESLVVGTLAIYCRRSDFDVGEAAGVLFPLAAQLGVYLRWAQHIERAWGAPGREPPSSHQARLKVRCLGQFQVLMDGHPVPVTRFRRAKALTLLKFLVSHRGRLVPRDAAVEALWPEADPVKASANLRVVLHSLRRALEPNVEKGAVSSFVLNRGELLCLDPSSRIWVDSEEFWAAARRGAHLASQGRADEALREHRRAAALYTGDYMEDEPYSDWCLFERERARETYLGLMMQMASLLEQGGDVDGAIEACRSALGVDRSREELHRDLMRLLWKADRRDEALRQYDTCRRFLAEEVGAEPTDETTALYMAIRAEASIVGGPPSA